MESPHEMTLELNFEKWKGTRGKGAAWTGQETRIVNPLAFLVCEKQEATSTESEERAGARSEMAPHAWRGGIWVTVAVGRPGELLVCHVCASFHRAKVSHCSRFQSTNGLLMNSTKIPENVTISLQAGKGWLQHTTASGVI